jgi:predicted nucleotide-binding protein
MSKQKNENVLQQQKRIKISQSDIPRYNLEDAIKLAQKLYDEFAGKSAPPHQLAMAIELSPTSSNWQRLSGTAVAYGLTDGAYNSDTISLTPLGKRIVASTKEGDDIVAKVEATLKPSILNRFYEKYNKAKFPSDKIALNVLTDFGVPQDRLAETYEIIKKNGEYVGIIHQTKTGLFVAVDTPKALETQIDLSITEPFIENEMPIDDSKQAMHQPIITQIQPKNNRVFITHGKKKEIVNQLKELLIFGKFTPIVAEEHETPSKPVSDKVMDDMRTCFAGVIHVSSEDELFDAKGNVHHKINENVLIEIGAALALFKNNFVLLVQKRIHLPSNLQGLYLCYYEGDRLDYEATMKLLKAFNEFK